MAEATTGTGSGAGVRKAAGAGAGAAADRRGPTSAEVFRAQVRLLFRRIGSLAGLVAVVALPLGLLAGVTAATEAAPSLSNLVGNLWSFPLLAGLFTPLAIVWRGEGPSERAYHWTLPVDRSAHQLFRVAAGWVHLMTGLAAGLLLAWALGAVFHGGMPPGRPGVLAGLFPSVTVLYLLGSVAAVATDHPLVWIFVAYLAVGAAQAVAAVRGWEWLATVVEQVVTTGPLSLSAAAAGPQGVEIGGSTDMVRWRPWRAVPLWIVVSAALTVAASRLHLERTGKS